MPNASNKTGGQLLRPVLTDSRPSSIGMMLKKLLAAAPSAVDAQHYAQEGGSLTRRRHLRCDGAPNAVVARLDALVPDRADLPRSTHLEEDGFLFRDRVPCSRPGFVLGRKKRGPAVAGDRPAGRRGSDVVICKYLAMCADEGIAVWSLQPVIWGLDGQLDASVLRTRSETLD